MQMAHLEQKSTDKEEGVNGEDLDGIESITEEFTVHLARAVNDAQQMENIVIPVTAQITSSVIAHGWQKRRQMHL